MRSRLPAESENTDDGFGRRRKKVGSVRHRDERGRSAHLVFPPLKPRGLPPTRAATTSRRPLPRAPSRILVERIRSASAGAETVARPARKRACFRMRR